MRQPENPFWPQKSILNPEPPKTLFVPVRRVKRALTRGEQKIVDAEAVNHFKIPIPILMEHAGLAVVEICEYMAGATTTPIHIFAGKGNNGGDAYVAARLLYSRGYVVTIWDCFPMHAHSGVVHDLREAAMTLGVPVRPAEEFDPYSLRSGVSRMIDEKISGMPCMIIDGIIGTGYEFARPLPAHLRLITNKITEARDRGARVLSIDIPTGVDANTGEVDSRAVSADCTVTFILPKEGMLLDRGREYSGIIRVFPIGLPIDFADRALRNRTL